MAVCSEAPEGAVERVHRTRTQDDLATEASGAEKAGQGKEKADALAEAGRA